MKFRIAILPGDGIGPEVMEQGVKVLRAVASRFGHDLELDYWPIGASAIDECGLPLPPETLEACRRSDSVLLGAVGDPRFESAPLWQRPERGLTDLRSGLGLNVSLRFATVYPALVNATRFKPEAIQGTDIVTVRDPIGFTITARESREWQEAQGKRVADPLVCCEEEARKVLRIAFEVARGRRKMVASVGQFNVLAFSKLWREVAVEVGKEYTDVELRLLAPDTACVQLLVNPRDFDVVISDNPMVGGMLDDLAATLGGGVGMSPSAELKVAGRDSYGNFGLHEPIHGSAPKYTGLDRVNPIGTIRSVYTLLLYSLSLPSEAQAVEVAIDRVLENYRTRDIMESGKTMVGTGQMGDLIAGAVLAGG
ncbi:MAG: isocitrate/isopropylmalate family dehydrogenase [Dehalococcoidia bacterium]|nr:isocitrate/isopropylmalate family dehydrogenase [Dehalococcoidia bacterium]